MSTTTAVQPLAGRTRVGAILTVARRWWLPLLAVIVVSVAGSGGTASAATPEHVKWSVVAPPVDLPAGAVCDFGLSPGVLVHPEPHPVLRPVGQSHTGRGHR
jgi:hypothetical protein